MMGRSPTGPRCPHMPQVRLEQTGGLRADRGSHGQSRKGTGPGIGAGVGRTNSGQTPGSEAALVKGMGVGEQEEGPPESTATKKPQPTASTASPTTQDVRAWETRAGSSATGGESAPVCACPLLSCLSAVSRSHTCLATEQNLSFRPPIYLSLCPQPSVQLGADPQPRLLRVGDSQKTNSTKIKV